MGGRLSRRLSSYRSLVQRARHGKSRRGDASRALAEPNARLVQDGQSGAPAHRDTHQQLADIEIRCFGRFELSRGGVIVERWRRRSAERVLKFLIVNGRRAHRDVLLDMLWPDVPISSSIRGLRVTLHALRHAIGQSASVAGSKATDLVRAEGDTYVLNTGDVWIDIDAFDQHYLTAVRLERERQVDAAVRAYVAAEALYRDDFLVEDLYEDWTVLPREELRDKYLVVLTKLAQFSLTSQDYEGCVRRSHSLLTKEPCREDAYQRLMQCYAQLGQRGSAARWYQICERTLREELDVAPSEETRRLYESIAAQPV